MTAPEDHFPPEDCASEQKLVRCGDCKHFVRDGKCNFLSTPEGRDPSRPFSFAPFWVWSDCYSDKEQVRSNVTSACVTYGPAERRT